jgi:dephospho-CoA kinase
MLLQLTSDAIDDAVEAIVAQHAASDDVVILEAALLGRDLYGIDGLIVVDAPEETAIARLTRTRGMQPDEARARMANQMPRAQRLATADLVIDNSADELALDGQLARAWEWLQALPPGTYRRRA